MGSDAYEQPRHLADNARTGLPNYGIGANSVIENAIIDKNARIGRDVRVLNAAGVVESEEAPLYVIRDKIVVIPKQTILPDGATI
jgi:glucose-1-phosphate adenylyltransferase